MTWHPTRHARLRPCAAVLAIVATMSTTGCLMPATVRMGAAPELEVPVLLGRVTRLGGGMDVPPGPSTTVVLSRQFPGVSETRVAIADGECGGAPDGIELFVLRWAAAHGESFVLFQGRSTIGIELYGFAWPRGEEQR